MILLLLSVAALIAPQQPPRDGARAEAAPAAATIRGRVVTSDTDAPVRDCLVRAWTENARESGYARTGMDGRFELTALRPGAYRIVATPTTTHAGYLASGLRRPGSAEAPRTIEVAAGQTVGDVVIRLVRGAAVSGRVIDERGEPVAFIDVRLGRPREGDLEWVSSNRAMMTDDLGRFRMAGLAPGAYVLVADPVSGALTASSPDPTSYLRTFYPAEADHSTAQPVSLEAGQDLDGIEIRLRRGRTYGISGRILDARGQPAGRAAGQLQAPEVAHELRVLPDGSFVAMNLPPGRYTIRANVRTGPPTPSTELGAVTVVLADADVDDVTLLLQPAATVSGTIIFEEGAKRVPFESVRVRASPFPRDTGFGDERLGAAVDRAGSFTLTSLLGPVLIRPEAGDLTLVSVRLGDADITDTPTDFKGVGEKRVEITLGAGASELAGRVAGRDGRVEADATVRVFARDRALWDFAFSTTRTVRTGVDGRYTIRGLRPGRYFAVALPGEGFVSSPASYFERLSRSAVPFEIEPAARAQVDLTIDEASRQP